MATLSAPTNTPTTDGAVIGCTTDDTTGTAYAMARIDRQWYSVANGDSQALADADKATILAQDITASELVWAGTDEDLTSVELTVTGLPENAGPYYVGWVQEDVVLDPNELVINGDFSAGNASWIEANGMVVNVANENVDCTASAAYTNSLGQDFTLAPGIYLLSYEIVSGTGTLRMRILGAGGGYHNIGSGVGVHSESITFNDACTGLRFSPQSEFTGVVDNISVYYTGEVPTPSEELITDGSFAENDTHWPVSNAQWSIESNEAQATAAPAGNGFSQAIVMPAGTYTLTYDIRDYVAGSTRCRITGANQYFGNVRSANGSFSEEFTITDANTAYVQYVTSEFTGTVDNISLKLS